MEIDKLKDKQKTETRKNQIAYQAIIKNHLQKHGMNTEKLRKGLSADLPKVARDITDSALKLGMEWLST